MLFRYSEHRIVSWQSALEDLCKIEREDMISPDL